MASANFLAKDRFLFSACRISILLQIADSLTAHTATDAITQTSSSSPPLPPLPPHSSLPFVALVARLSRQPRCWNRYICMVLSYFYISLWSSSPSNAPTETLCKYKKPLTQLYCIFSINIASSSRFFCSLALYCDNNMVELPLL